MTPAMKRGLIRFGRVVWIPAFIAVLDAAVIYLQAGSFDMDVKILAIAFAQSLALGSAKWLRDEIDVNVKVL